MRAHELVNEADLTSQEANEIAAAFKRANYKMLGSGADATVWAKPTGNVIKVIMPEEGGTKAAETFKKFVDFAIGHSDLACMPRFQKVNGKAYTYFNIQDKEFLMIAMERLYPLEEGSFEEAMVWQLSDLATTGKNWEEAVSFITDPNQWVDYTGSMEVDNIIQKYNQLDEVAVNEYAVLYTTMRLLYHTGRINRYGWDLHTENVMKRADGTLVIVDPWFEVSL